MRALARLRKDWRICVTTVKDILDFFEDFAPVADAMDFDNCGLLVGDKNRKINRVLLSLDITSEVVLEALESDCELIISHHPVIFSPLKRLDTNSAAYLLAKHDIAAVCMHTNLDLSEKFGVNLCLANAIGVKNPVKSELGECMFIGTLASERTAKDFAAMVKTALGCEGLRYTNVRPTVKKVAVACGAGGSDIFAAAKEGADVLMTGEIKHHEINAANELGVNVIDAGHFKSEDIVILKLKEKLCRQFPEIIFTKSKKYSDKMKYL